MKEEQILIRNDQESCPPYIKVEEKFKELPQNQVQKRIHNSYLIEKM